MKLDRCSKFIFPKFQNNEGKDSSLEIYIWNNKEKEHKMLRNDYKQCQQDKWEARKWNYTDYSLIKLREFIWGRGKDVMKYLTIAILINERLDEGCERAEKNKPVHSPWEWWQMLPFKDDYNWDD